MDDKKKKFVSPEAIIVDFSNEDIITASEATDTLKWGEGTVDGTDF